MNASIKKSEILIRSEKHQKSVNWETDLYNETKIFGSKFANFNEILKLSV